MTTYVLVHGGNLSSDTWNRLAGKNEYSPGLRLGGKIWDTIIPSLQKEHHRVFAPTLQDEHSYSLSDHIDQICALIEEHQLKDIILVGASYGGLVITGVANRMKERIDLLVYLDAAFCEPGESLFDLLKKANLNPDTATGGQARAYKEKIAFDPQTIDIIPKLYVRCTKSSFAPVIPIRRNKATKSPNLLNTAFSLNLSSP